MTPIENKTRRMLILERLYQIPIEELLRQLYVDRNMSVREIADELLIGVGSCHRWIIMAGITTRQLIMNNPKTERKNKHVRTTNQANSG